MDHPGRLCKFPAFDVAEGRFPTKFCSAGTSRIIRPKEFMVANHEPVRRIRPSFGFVVEATVSPYELGRFKIVLAGICR